MADTPHVYPEGCYFNSLEDIRDKHITIMGLGLNGGGEASVRFFLSHGAYVTVTDMKSRQELEPTILSLTSDKLLDRSRLSYVLGEHRIEDFQNADCVIKNPGVRYEGNKFLAAAKHVETDLSVFLHFTKAPVIAVTGSKGKSSTSSAIYYGLQKAGFSPFLGGNITVSPLSFLERTDGMTPVVLELSSWQLRDLRGRKALRPKVAVITRIMPDHQNWYGDMDSYVDDKRLIYADQTEDDFLILSSDPDGYKEECSHTKPGCESWSDDFAQDAPATVLRVCCENLLPAGSFGAFLRQGKDGTSIGMTQLPFSMRSKHAQDHGIQNEQVLGSLLVPGKHMMSNALAAALALQMLGITPAQISDVLAEWPGLPHRLEAFHKWVSPTDGRRLLFFNDSCATVPEAAAAASQAFGTGIILITGGTDKGLDFLPLARTVSGEDGSSYKLKELYLLAGTGTDKLMSLLDARHIAYRGPFGSLEELLNELKRNLAAPDAKQIYGVQGSKKSLPVVFSPGATSFGMFSNEFDRGERFKKAVKGMFF
ncbi:MAG: UDP-N-acetylmuramoyl-L-alanine--D-glutamate ligase [Treponema sp.]|nr:UDP-N-acetylmuramoyl-L-alanine--D-glutamate ligase [Treponema sp.]